MIHIPSYLYVVYSIWADNICYGLLQTYIKEMCKRTELLMQWSIRLNRKLPQNHSNTRPRPSPNLSSYVQGWLTQVIKIHLKEYKDCWKKTNCSICLSKCPHSAQMNNFLTPVVLLTPAGTSRVTNIISRVNLYYPC